LRAGRSRSVTPLCSTPHFFSLKSSQGESTIATLPRTLETPHDDKVDLSISSGLVVSGVGIGLGHDWLADCLGLAHIARLIFEQNVSDYHICSLEYPIDWFHISALQWASRQ
jgi:hypothetical protein